MKKQRKITALLFACVLFTGMLFGCASGSKTSGSEDGGESAAAIEADIDRVPIETKYGTLYYPEQWMESLETEQTEADESLEVLFRAKIGEQQIDLFALTIGDGADDSAGTLTGPDGVKRDVHVKLLELPDLSGLSEGEMNRVYAMQEAVNDVLDSLT